MNEMVTLNFAAVICKPSLVPELTRPMRATIQLRVLASSNAYAPPPYGPQVSDAVKALRLEFTAVDDLVAQDLNRVMLVHCNLGYGHNDVGGRDALDQAFAEIVGAEAAIVRSQFFSGTNAIACTLYAALRPGGELPAVVGAPYDTLEEVIGLWGTSGHGSLKEYWVSYREDPLTDDGELDWDALGVTVKPDSKCALIQRSCGYSWHKTLSAAEIQRAQNPNCVIVVDNCYGEFMEIIEPTVVGTPLVAEVTAAEGYNVLPSPRVRRCDIIQAVQFGSKERLLAFCGAAQRCCPVGSYIQPVAGATSGYESEVVFADGTFMDGSTNEMSCDGPLREPFVVFCQVVLTGHTGILPWKS